METAFSPARDLVVLPSAAPVPGGRVLPVQAFLLRGAEPVLIDAGMTCERAAFLDALDSVIHAAELRWLVLSHEDADHLGALLDLLELAPRAQLVTTATGFGKLSAAAPIAPERVHLVAPGGQLEAGGRVFDVLRPPMYDSPATVALFERRERWLFTSDGFGAFLPSLAERLEDQPLAPALDGMSEFCRLNSPWLADVERARYERHLAAWAGLDPALVLPSHLPPLGPEAWRLVLERARQLPAEGEVALPQPQAA